MQNTYIQKIVVDNKWIATEVVRYNNFEFLSTILNEMKHEYNPFYPSVNYLYLVMILDYFIKNNLKNNKVFVGNICNIAWSDFKIKFNMLYNKYGYYQVCKNRVKNKYIEVLNNYEL